MNLISRPFEQWYYPHFHWSVFGTFSSQQSSDISGLQPATGWRQQPDRNGSTAALWRSMPKVLPPHTLAELGLNQLPMLLSHFPVLHKLIHLLSQGKLHSQNTQNA